MNLPLEGLTVLDLSRVLAGPYATYLPHLGAEVWKVERPGAGDETRAWGPPFVGDASAYYLSVNRNKKSVAADLADASQCAAVPLFQPPHCSGCDARSGWSFSFIVCSSI